MISFVLLFSVAFGAYKFNNVTDAMDCGAKAEGVVWQGNTGTCECNSTHPYRKTNAQGKDECVAKCGEFYDLTNDNCTKCATGKKWDVYKIKCLDKCPDGFTEDNGKCKCPTGQYYNKFTEKCVATCPKDTGSNANPADTTTGMCNCTNANYNSEKNECVVECPEKYEPNDKKVCTKCEGTAKPYYELVGKKCVAKCEEGLAPINGTCKVCRDEATNKFYNNGTCVASCPDGFGGLDMNICKNCSATNFTKYIQDGKCVQACSDGYALINNKTCKSCANEPTNKLYDPIAEKCVASCAEGSEKGKDKYASYCVCKADYYADNVNKKCVKECPAKYQKETESDGDRVCTKCEKLYNEATKKCVDKCPEKTTEKDGICKSNGVNGLFLVLAMALFFIF